MYPPIRRTRIDVLCSSGFCGAKITPYKGTKDAVSPICHNTTVLWMGFEFRFGMVRISECYHQRYGISGSKIDEPIIKVPNTKMLVLDSFKFFIAAHFS